jgi:uncharacterized protein (DUF608 family)
MKFFPAIIVVMCGALVPGVSSRADDSFNPVPTTIQSPRDDAAVTRLTVSSEGKTPTEKKLDPAWIKTLADRGEPTLFTKDNSNDFAYIGMPVGGIGAGELYLSGDGRLWDWDIFGTMCKPGFPVEQGLAYVHPHKVSDPADGAQIVVDQGFVVRTKQGDKVDTRTLDKDGFSNVTFSGQYPVGTVNYSDPGSPIKVKLDAYSPFIPSNLADSTYPATILTYTIENTSKDKVDCTIGGWMENPTGVKVRKFGPVILDNAAVDAPSYHAVNYSIKMASSTAKTPTVFDDFESGKYDHWTAEGDAFGTKPAGATEFTHTSPVQGVQGNFFIDSFASSSDKGMGKLTSAPFVIDRAFLTFAVGGGADVKKEAVNLLIDGNVVRSASGQNDEILRAANWDLRPFAGKTAQIQIIDQASGGWSHILVDNFVFADVPFPLETSSDVGDMTLAVLGDGTGVAQLTGDSNSNGCLDTAPSATAELNVPQDDKGKLVGGVRRSQTLAPGAKMMVSFIIAWHFPNPLTLGLSTDNSRQAGTRFKSAQEVVDHLAANFDQLSAATLAWRDTWYDSTLPYYFLDRTLLNVSTLATSTSYLLSDGRFYGYEGRYSCPGTCTHVWSYQQAIGYLFPDLEKTIMEKTEFVLGLGMNADGGVAMRGEFDKKPPVDGQAGVILRTFLADRMSKDHDFITKNYPSVKKAMEYMIDKYDVNKTGVMAGPQANTMDAAWYGEIAWLSLYYQAALRATAVMADEANDADYAKSLRAMADQGRGLVETQLFNGEYFVHLADPAHPDSPGTYNGCPIEQLMGQNWAYQVGLGDIVDRTKATTALDSIWKYDYTTDAGVYRDKFKTGRWYANAGESGLIMCTFPNGSEDALSKGSKGFAAYDNECWAGSEYEAAALMMWDGQVDKALAEVKSLAERYAPTKRNPWNELECGSHYSRSMSSYGVFIAASGFQYDGQSGTMAFAPRVSPEDFKAAFTSAEGWGSFSQKYNGKGMDASLDLRYGSLHLKKLSLNLPSGSTAQTAKVQVDGKDVATTVTRQGDWISISFPAEQAITTGQSLKVAIAP